MKVEHADLLALKIAAVASAGGGILGGLFIEGQIVPFFFVSATTLGMAAAGSLLAFTYGTPVKGNGKLFGFAMGGVFMGVWAIHLLRWRGVDIPEQVAGPIAGCIALVSRWALPAIVETFPGLWRGVLQRVFGINVESKK